MKRSISLIPAVIIAAAVISGICSTASAERYDHLYEAELASGIFFEEAPFDSVRDSISAEFSADSDGIDAVYRYEDGNITVRKSLKSITAENGETLVINGTTVCITISGNSAAAVWSKDGWTYSITTDASYRDRIPVIAEGIIR